MIKDKKESVRKEYGKVAKDSNGRIVILSTIVGFIFGNL